MARGLFIVSVLMTNEYIMFCHSLNGSFHATYELHIYGNVYATCIDFQPRDFLFVLLIFISNNWYNLIQLWVYLTTMNMPPIFWLYVLITKTLLGVFMLYINSIARGICGCTLKWVNFELILRIGISSLSFEIAITRPHRWLVNIGPGNNDPEVKGWRRISLN